MSKVDMKFLEGFRKNLQEAEGIGTSSEPPSYWYTSGNYVLNKIISGKFDSGIPQGRVTNLAGSSGSGKSFLAANFVREAQKQGAFIFVLDSENALDDEFMTKIGVDTTDGYIYASVTTINHVSAQVASFLKQYKAEYKDQLDTAPQVLILVDSLDMLMTETETEHYDKGVMKGDHGQRSKQLKALLRTFVQDIKALNVAMIVTSQVYKNQDVLNGEGLWIVSDAVKFSASQIILLSKLKLKDKEAGGAVMGIRMKCEGYKTRFTQPFQTVTIEVPYETGIDPLSGLLETALDLDIIVKKGSRYALTGSEETWYSKDIGKYADQIIKLAEEKQDLFLKANLTEIVEVTENVDTVTDTTKKRRGKLE